MTIEVQTDVARNLPLRGVCVLLLGISSSFRLDYVRIFSDKGATVLVPGNVDEALAVMRGERGDIPDLVVYEMSFNPCSLAYRVDDGGLTSGFAFYQAVRNDIRDLNVLMFLVTNRELDVLRRHGCLPSEDDSRSFCFHAGDILSSELVDTVIAALFAVSD